MLGDDGPVLADYDAVRMAVNLAGPIPAPARTLTDEEAIVGQLFPATLLARLVSLEIESRRR
jgi:hypothetical protein